MPMLPYREPKLLNNEEEIISVLKEEEITNVMLVTGKVVRSNGLTSSLENKLNQNFSLTVFDDAVINPTTDSVMHAVDVYKSNGCQCLIAFGGGSVIDLAKAIGASIACPNKKLYDMKGLLKVNHKTPILIAIPTTAGTGSEATLSAVITNSKTHHKFTINDFDLIPDYALHNPSLTLGLPSQSTATTGMDALTHAIEAYIGRSTTKSTRNYSLEAIKLIFENLENSYHEGSNLQARENMLKASYCAGLAFSKSYVGYVHAISHSLGGKYNVPHAYANAIILPHMLRFYGKEIYKKLWKIGLYVGMFDENTTKEDGARIVIEKIESMNKNMNIGNSFDCIVDEDIPYLAKTASKEANPLYPVPVLYSAKNLENVYKIIKK